MTLFISNRKKMISYLSALSISLLAPQISYAAADSKASTTSSTPTTTSNGSDPSSTASNAVAALGAEEGNLNLDKASVPSSLPADMGPQCTAAANMAHPAVAPVATLVEKGCLQVIDAAKTCETVFATTTKFCHTEKNESLVSSLATIQGLMSVAQGVTNACNNFGKAMDVAKLAMAAYSTACSAAQVACGSKCGGAVTAVTTFVNDLKAGQAKMKSACSAMATTDPSAPANCNIMDTKVNALIATLTKESTPETQPGSVASKAKVCKIDVTALLGTAMLNIAALAQSKAQSDQCKKDAEIAAKSCDKAENKNKDECVKCEDAAYKDHEKCKKVAVIVCDQAENQDKPICICKANPRAAGCEGVSTAGAQLSTMTTGGVNGSGRTPSGSIVNAGTGASNGKDFPSALKSNGTDGTSSGGGGGFGSGSSAGLSGNSAADTSKGDAKSDASKLSANILDSGGGGGGAGYRGSTYTSPEYRDKLKAYAAKNGIGKLAGNSWSDQVTGTAGRTNFEKVKARYQENKSSLLSK